MDLDLPRDDRAIGGKPDLISWKSLDKKQDSNLWAG